MHIYDQIINIKIKDLFIVSFVKSLTVNHISHRYNTIPTTTINKL